MPNTYSLVKSQPSKGGGGAILVSGDGLGVSRDEGEDVPVDLTKIPGGRNCSDFLGAKETVPWVFPPPPRSK